MIRKAASPHGRWPSAGDPTGVREQGMFTGGPPGTWESPTPPHPKPDRGNRIEKLSIMIRLHLETLGRDHALAHVLQIETRHSRRFMSLFTRGKLGEYLNRVRNIIIEGQESGVFRGDISPGLATNLVFGAVDEIVTSWLLAERPGDLVRHHRPLVRMLTDGIAPCKNHGGEQA